jgi:hypothetical protein
MVHSIRKAVSLCALLLLAGSTVPLRANPWKMAKAAAVALAIWGAGQPPLAAGATPIHGGADALQPVNGPIPGGPGLDLGEVPPPMPAAGAEDPLVEGDPATPYGCSEACGARFNPGLIHCETFLQMRALRNLCISRLLADEEACMRRCEGR